MAIVYRLLMYIQACDMKLMYLSSFENVGNQKSQISVACSNIQYFSIIFPMLGKIVKDHSMCEYIGHVLLLRDCVWSIFIWIFGVSEESTIDRLKCLNINVATN